MGVNKRPLSMREGKIFLDGALIADSCKFNVVFTPKVWEGKTLGEMGTNRRYTGYDITGTLEAWKSTNLIKSKIMEYVRTGRTPEMTITGINEDTNSDYYDTNGADKVTLAGCVLTGDVTLMDLDTDGDVAKESLKFGAKKIVE